MTSLLILRRLKARGQLDSLVFYKRQGFDGQGAPAYGPPDDVSARAVREESETLDNEGNRISTQLTLIVPQEEPRMKRGDRVEFEGEAFRVENEKQGKRISGEISHYRYECVQVGKAAENG